MFENDELMPRFIPKPTATGNTDYLLAPRPMVPELSLMFGGPNGGANVGITAGAFSSPRTERNAPGPQLPTYLMDLQQLQQEQTSSLSYAYRKMNRPSQSHITVQQLQAASPNAKSGVGVGSKMYLNTRVPPPMPQYMPNTMYRNYGRTAPSEFSALSSSALPQLYNPGNVDSKIYRLPPAVGDANTTETAATAAAAAAIATVNSRFNSVKLPKMTNASSQTAQKSVKDFQDIMMELFLQLSSKQDLQQISLRLEIIEMQVSYLQNGYAGLLNSLNRQEQLLMEIMDRLGGSEVEEIHMVKTSAGSGRFLLPSSTKKIYAKMFENDELMPRFIPKPTATGNTDYLLAPRPMVPELSLMFGGPNGGANVGITAGAFSSPRTERNAPGPQLPTYLMDLQQLQQEQTSSLSYANRKMNRPSKSHITVQQLQAASPNAKSGVGVGSKMYLNTSVPPPMPQYMPNTMYRNYGRTAPPEFSALSSSALPQLYNPGNVDSKIYRLPPAAGDANTTETAATATAAAAIATVNSRFNSVKLPKMTNASSQTEQKSVKDFQDIMMELFLQLSSKQDLQQISLRLEIIEMQVSYLQNGYPGLLNSLNRQEQLLMEIMDRLGGSEVEVCSNGDDSGDGSGSSGTARTARTAGSARSTDSTESGTINSQTAKTPTQSAPPPPPPPGLPPQISSYSFVVTKNYYNVHMPKVRRFKSRFPNQFLANKIKQ